MSAKPARFNSVFTLAFSLDHHDRDASDVSAADVYTAIRARLRELSFAHADEVLDAVWPPEDTYELEPTRPQGVDEPSATS